MADPQGDIDFFISYRGAQSAWARWVNWVVRSAGYSTVLMDEFQVGTTWTNNMRQAAQSCRRLIPLYSADYWVSGACAEEFDAYWQLHLQDGTARFIIPFGLEPSAVPQMFGMLLWEVLYLKTRDEARATILKALEGIMPANADRPAYAEPEPPVPGAVEKDPPKSAEEPESDDDGEELPTHYPGEGQTESRAMQDQASVVDSLGREGLVAALGEFILAKDTHTPLTVTIEAPWGEGKTSAMRQLQHHVEAQGARTVWFNPWRYTEAETLWSGFLAEFTEQVQKNHGFWKRLQTHRRYLNSIHGAWVLEKCVAGLLIWPWIAYWLRSFLFEQIIPPDKSALEVLKHVLAHAFTWLSLIAILAKLYFAFHKPLRTLVGQVKIYLKKPNYAAECGTSERLHKEFAAWLTAAIKPNQRVYVFIDDLDRCAASRAAELMEWLQLLMSDAGGRGDGRRLPLVLIAGLDREKVAAGVAVQHGEVLNILAPADSAKARSEAAIIWGYEYLEKFIDLPIRLPPSSRQALETYLSSLAPGAMAAERLERERMDKLRQRRLRRRRFGSVSASSLTAGSAANDESTNSQEQPATKADLSLEDRRIPSILRCAAYWLNHSPRRLKHFLNLLRFRWSVRKRMPGDLMSLDLTARLVLIETARPTLFRAIADHRSVRDALFTKRHEEEPAVFEPKSADWAKALADKGCQADVTWLQQHGYSVLRGDWDRVLSDNPNEPEEPEVGLTLSALNALVDGTIYRYQGS